ncbi:hypothetical protein ACVCAH_14345 [Micromonospora sp. LZ34]
MTMVWLSIGALVLLLAGVFGYLGWRDRSRLSSPDDTAADRAARIAQERYGVDVHASQGEIYRARNDSSG